MDLKFYRKRAGLSQSALARKAGLGVSTIRQIEYGYYLPPRQTIEKIAGALGDNDIFPEWERDLKIKCARPAN